MRFVDIIVIMMLILLIRRSTICPLLPCLKRLNTLLLMKRFSVCWKKYLKPRVSHNECSSS
jgi:hypothetical protein